MSENRGDCLGTDPDLPQVIQFDSVAAVNKQMVDKHLNLTKSDRFLKSENKEESKEDKAKPMRM